VSLTPFLGQKLKPPPPAPDTPSPERESPVPCKRATPETNIVSTREESSRPLQPATAPNLSVPPSIRFLSIPRQLHTLLSFLGPEHFQVSDTTSSELDMTLWVVPFLGCHTQASQQLTLSVQPPCCAATIEVVWHLSPGSQARCYIAWRHLKHCR